MKNPISKFLIVAAISLSSAQADEPGRSDSPFDFSALDWFGSVSTTYLDSSGEVTFHGTTASVYGGTPTIKMDDGLGLSLALGIETSDGWRLSGDLSYVTANSSSDAVFGIDDRADDTFVLDAEIESLVFMLNGSYDFDIGLDRFTPFLKAGVGVARNKTKSALLDVSYDSLIWNGTSFDDLDALGISFPAGRTTEFAWNIGAGIRMALSERFELSMAYGLMDLGNAVTETNDGGDALAFSDLISQRVQLELDYRF